MLIVKQGAITERKAKMRTMNPMRIPSVSVEMFIAAIERQLGRPIDDSEQEIVDRMAARNWPATAIADELGS